MFEVNESKLDEKRLKLATMTHISHNLIKLHLELKWFEILNMMSQ